MQREQAFHGAMSALLNALDGQDYRAADQALESAAKLKPGAPELADARRRLADGRKRNRLLRLRSSARKAVAGEEWVEASKLYAEALKLDPDAAFARDGLQTARQRLKLQQRIEGYIRHPDRLQSDQPLADARSLLHHLEAVADPGPKLRAAEEELARLVAVAGSKVVVRIHSDEATEVVIYRVGRFGKFLRREVELRPGSYTLVGSRAGYRDVRRTLEVQPGPGIDVVVRCEERI
jgi:tetratricopeptide (TPR) repeat protein